ncbi:hypothetical protein QP994_06475 [Corynebacterium sp. MSK044]|uniref:hypothetical protein n=1 Tax=Corynebacterium sp. MSK044 TaxID=3050195 RepID=UPI002550D37A|nr:hypothetical protein [Corynebacterium sp. MSK044]MDK8797528.1 hypothetical protein [Corynebacterium sp. MSK044]
MKRRFIAAGLAAATALSLSVAPAYAIELPMTSSYESSSERIEKRLKDADKSGNKKELRRAMSSAAAFEKLMEPFKENDFNNSYKIGTTFDILLGTGVAAALLALLGGAAFQQGLI